MANILLFDLETAPNLGFTWGKYDQNVIKVVRPWYVLCAAYQWVGRQKSPQVIAQPHFDDHYANHPHCDLMVVEQMWELMDQADIIVAHNLNKFDLKKINARFAHHKLGPPSPSKPVDTLQVARRAFAFNSNRLDDLGQELELGRKVTHEGFGLWESCMNGDEAAWRRMIRYAKQDVALLHELYLELLPWMPDNSPNLATIDGRPDACPRCGRNEGFQARGWRHTKTCTYRRFRCNACGYYPSQRAREKDLHSPEMV